MLPTLGSKEPIYHLAQALIGAGSPRDLVAVTTPGYPVPARGAAFAGAQTLAMALDPASGWLPAYDALDAATWRRLALVWLTTPNNPTGAVAPLAYLEDLAERCRRHGVVLACDEAYGALYLGDQRPASVLELSDPTHVLALHSLSKRSSVPGYRSGFVAGDPLLIAALKQLRPSLGVTPQRFVQRASIAAWEDEEHVDAARERYRAKDVALRPGLDAAGLQVEGGDGGIFRWCRVPGGGDGEAFAERLLGHGVVVTPGAFLGDGGAQHVRIALVPSLADCEAAVARFAAAAQ